MMSKKKKDPASINITGENVLGSINAGGHAKVEVTPSSVHKPAAVKRVCELTGAGLRVSKEFVDGLQ